MQRKLNQSNLIGRKKIHRQSIVKNLDNRSKSRRHHSTGIKQNSFNQDTQGRSLNKGQSEKDEEQFSERPNSKAQLEPNDQFWGAQNNQPEGAQNNQLQGAQKLRHCISEIEQQLCRAKSVFQRIGSMNYSNVNENKCPPITDNRQLYEFNRGVRVKTQEAKDRVISLNSQRGANLYCKNVGVIIVNRRHSLHGEGRVRVEGKVRVEGRVKAVAHTKQLTDQVLANNNIICKNRTGLQRDCIKQTSILSQPNATHQTKSVNCHTNINNNHSYYNQIKQPIATNQSFSKKQYYPTSNGRIEKCESQYIIQELQDTTKQIEHTTNEDENGSNQSKSTNIQQIYSNIVRQINTAKLKIKGLRQQIYLLKRVQGRMGRQLIAGQFMNSARHKCIDGLNSRKVNGKKIISCQVPVENLTRVELAMEMDHGLMEYQLLLGNRNQLKDRLQLSERSNIELADKIKSINEPYQKAKANVQEIEKREERGSLSSVKPFKQDTIQAIDDTIINQQGNSNGDQLKHLITHGSSDLRHVYEAHRRRLELTIKKREQSEEDKKRQYLKLLRQFDGYSLRDNQNEQKLRDLSKTLESKYCTVSGLLGQLDTTKRENDDHQVIISNSSPIQVNKTVVYYETKEQKEQLNSSAYQQTELSEAVMASHSTSIVLAQNQKQQQLPQQTIDQKQETQNCFQGKLGTQIPPNAPQQLTFPLQTPRDASQQAKLVHSNKDQSFRVWRQNVTFNQV